jgi:hypothetical protein
MYDFILQPFIKNIQQIRWKKDKRKKRSFIWFLKNSHRKVLEKISNNVNNRKRKLNSQTWTTKNRKIDIK